MVLAVKYFNNPVVPEYELIFDFFFYIFFRMNIEEKSRTDYNIIICATVPPLIVWFYAFLFCTNI